MGFLKAGSFWITWHPPVEGWVKLNSDGAYRSSMEMASAGGMLRNDQGNWVWGYMVKIGKMKSFMAELWGLREDLRLCEDKGIDKLMVELDSNSVVNLMTGNVEGDEDVPTLVGDCRILATWFGCIMFSHVYREGNMCADALASLAQEGDWGTMFLNEPPDELVNLLAADAAGAVIRRIR